MAGILFVFLRFPNLFMNFVAEVRLVIFLTSDLLTYVVHHVDFGQLNMMCYHS